MPQKSQHNNFAELEYSCCYLLVLSMVSKSGGLRERCPRTIISGMSWSVVMETTSCRNPQGVPIVTSRVTSPNDSLGRKWENLSGSPREYTRLKRGFHSEGHSGMHPSLSKLLPQPQSWCALHNYFIHSISFCRVHGVAIIIGVC